MPHIHGRNAKECKTCFSWLHCFQYVKWHLSMCCSRQQSEPSVLEADMLEAGKTMHSLKHIIKFADNTTVVGLISKNDKSAYRKEVQQLTAWCGANNLSLNIDKTKEMVVDFRRAHSGHSPLIIDWSSVDIVQSNKFLGVHLADNLTWSLNTRNSITKKVQQRLYFLRRLRKSHLPPQS
ncbi:hypothetical protein C0J50_1858 [Silurus asotus]|uniref:Alkylated DNA repair protein AlkB homologue 8 N-terminal domain-containing protein n=1 Tax=Silurus asotus TaxID=30991 RepID=A0AAD5A0I8_SILAS|nr:hypothetical protein C0J50_1858 [Silurus asotus]